MEGTSPVVQQLRLRAPNAGGPGLTPDQRTRSRMVHLGIPRATMNTWCSQTNIYIYLFFLNHNGNYIFRGYLKGNANT